MTVRVVMWMLPEFFALLLVVFGPWLYREVVSGVLDKAITRLKVKKEKPTALADYYLDFNLAVIAVLLLAFNAVKLAAAYYPTKSELSFELLLGVVFYLFGAFIWLRYLYRKNNIEDYLMPTEQKIPVLYIFGLKHLKWGRVSGMSGLRIWWTRFFPAAFALGMAYLVAPKYAC
jgi:hypothetical protein